MDTKDALSRRGRLLGIEGPYSIMYQFFSLTEETLLHQNDEIGFGNGNRWQSWD